jgi:hypothetical protein
MKMTPHVRHPQGFLFDISESQHGFPNFYKSASQSTYIDLTSRGLDGRYQASLTICDMKVFGCCDDLVLVDLKVTDVLGKHFSAASNINCQVGTGCLISSVQSRRLYFGENLRVSGWRRAAATGTVPPLLKPLSR